MQKILIALVVAALPLLVGCPNEKTLIVRSKQPHAPECEFGPLSGLPHKLILEPRGGGFQQHVCVSQQNYDRYPLGSVYNP